MCRCNSERANLAGADVRKHGVDRADGHDNLVSEQSQHRGRRPFVGHMDEIGPGHGLEQLARQLMGRARPSAAVSQYARFGLGGVDKVFDSLVGGGGVYAQYEGHRAHERDRLEIFDRVVGQLREEADVSDMRVGRQQQCMAVGFGSSHQLGSDIAPCAGPVFHHQ